jgi:aryl-alcohol dehydrogenase-like predicted oxidoreductase
MRSDAPRGAAWDYTGDNMQTRREFLLTSSVAVTAALHQKADAAPETAKGEWRNKQSGVAYRRLGRTGYMVSEVVMGGNPVTRENYEHVLVALDRGMNYLDTAPAYGNGESELGYAKVIASRPRDSFFLNSKVSLWDINRNKLYRDIYDSLSESEQKKIDTQVEDELARTEAFRPDYIVDYFTRQREEVRNATLGNVMAAKYGRQIDRGKNYKQLILDSVDQSLTRLGTDYLDLLMCPHGASTETEIREHPEIFEAFEVLKKSGKVRHLGHSSHSIPTHGINAAIDMKMYSAAMVAYNVVNHPFVKPALERAKKEDFGVIAMKAARPVYSEGNRRPPKPERVEKINNAVADDVKIPQKAYLFVLRNENLSAVISNMSTTEMVEDNIRLAVAKAA